MLPVEDFVIYVVDIPKSQLPKGTPPGYVQEDGDHPGITWASKNAVDWYEEQVKLPWKRVEEQKLKTRFNYHQVDFVIQNRNWTLYVPHQPGIVLDKKGWERNEAREAEPHAPSSYFCTLSLQ